MDGALCWLMPSIIIISIKVLKGLGLGRVQSSECEFVFMWGNGCPFFACECKWIMDGRRLIMKLIINTPVHLLIKWPTNALLLLLLATILYFCVWNYLGPQQDRKVKLPINILSAFVRIYHSLGGDWNWSPSESKRIEAVVCRAAGESSWGLLTIHI